MIGEPYFSLLQLKGDPLNLTAEMHDLKKGVKRGTSFLRISGAVLSLPLISLLGTVLCGSQQDAEASPTVITLALSPPGGMWYGVGGLLIEEQRTSPQEESGESSTRNATE
ncbi:hypothetical protein MYX82_11010 [Acidobacteria bacterium AH-259-D05]|nr:hypothetical protein [Acidobacteria bacterium AH-259-D05]